LPQNKIPEPSAVTNATDKKRPPPVVEQKNPEPELEEKLRKHPHDRDAKVDLGSDESMDASDPPSVTQPEHNEPVPSSGFEDESKT
jgi:hypothetical protein